jgi:adenosine kinase
VAPDGRDGMKQHAEQFAAAGIPFMFDPGQGLPMFNGEELASVHRPGHLGGSERLRGADAAERTGLTPRADRRQGAALIVTRGGEGSHIYADGQEHDIPTAKPAVRQATPRAAATPTARG